MTIENKFQETRRAGILDKIVRATTLGKYGVDETVAFGLKDNYTGEIFQESPLVHAVRIRRQVYVADLSKTVHVLKRKIVKR